MGIFDFIKNQFIEVIEWTDTTTNTIVYQFPVHKHEIKMGAQLTVRESQAAIFVNEGQIADIFNPGRYVLSTENMPVLTKLKSWMYGFNSPFKADVYFVNTKQFTDQKWGTANPIMMRDAEFGVIRLRAFGNFSFRVTDPAQFLREVFGTNQVYDTQNIVGQIRRIIISGLSDLLGESKIPALDLAMYYDELSEHAKEKIQKHLDALGLSLTSLFIENISLPEEVEKVLDKRTSMGILGDLNKYTKYQSAEAIRDAAQNDGGLAGAGVGLGAGAALGNAFSQTFQNINQQPNNSVICPKCQAKVPVDHRFCGNCGNAMRTPQINCVKCNAEIPADAKFCPKCGTPQAIERFCPKCGQQMEVSSKFCPKCGTKAE